jgi:hypothetical protein
MVDDRFDSPFMCTPPCGADDYVDLSDDSNKLEVKTEVSDTEESATENEVRRELMKEEESTPTRSNAEITAVSSSCKVGQRTLTAIKRMTNQARQNQSTKPSKEAVASLILCQTCTSIITY